jgi:hypothetical protein
VRRVVLAVTVPLISGFCHRLSAGGRWCFNSPCGLRGSAVGGVSCRLPEPRRPEVTKDARDHNTAARLKQPVHSMAPPAAARGLGVPRKEMTKIAYSPQADAILAEARTPTRKRWRARLSLAASS